VRWSIREHGGEPPSVRLMNCSTNATTYLSHRNTLGRVLFGCTGRLAALLMLFAAGTLVGACHFTDINTTVSPGAIGQVVRDGTFDFTVTQVNSSPTVGDRRAQGVYATVSLTVKNVGVEPERFEWFAQRLKDSIGRQYWAVFVVPLLFGNVVNAVDPGLEVRINVAFDVPPGTKPTQIVLHESLSSDGARVNLTKAPGDSER
jgi:Domain of unknown function (DUF4352)